MFKEVKNACAKCRGQGSSNPGMSMMEIAAAAMMKPSSNDHNKPMKPANPKPPMQSMPDGIQQSFPLMMAMVRRNLFIV